MSEIQVGDRVPMRRDGDEAAQQRQVKGFLRYPEPPAPGTLVGPNGWGETCLVLGTRLDRTAIGLATNDDFEWAVQHGVAGVPGSPLYDAVHRAVDLMRRERQAKLLMQ